MQSPQHDPYASVSKGSTRNSDPDETSNAKLLADLRAKAPGGNTVAEGHIWQASEQPAVGVAEIEMMLVSGNRSATGPM